MAISKYTVVDFLSLTPNKCVIYPRFFRNTEYDGKHRTAYDSPTAPTSSSARTTEPKKLPESNKHNFELSKSAAKNLRQKVTWLYYYAKKKTIITRKGKQLSNFKMNFATLKLPSEQVHSSDFITKNCLNQLFVEISKKYDFRNYVWRLEYQKNGNLHYHIATDTYIDYHFLLRTWNRILNKYGYVDLYSRKFAQMDFGKYRKIYAKDSDTDFSILQERYAKGCREGWKNPNTVDVKAVFGKNNIGSYISKYMAKNSAPGEQINLPVCELNSANSRLWFCSRSLSKCERLADIRESMDCDIFGTILNNEGVYKVVHDYCVVLYYDFLKLSAISKKVISSYLEEYRTTVDYYPA